MKLKEIELDLPYKKNIKYIQEMQKYEKKEYLEATRKDYDENWKTIRREFQLRTRCMTSMIERLIDPIYTEDCWKILIECVDSCVEKEYKNLLGVYVVQISFDKEEFFKATNFEQKKKIIDIVIQGIHKLANLVDFDISPISNVCQYIIDNEYINEWYWNKPVCLDNKAARIKVVHDISVVQIFVVITNDNKIVMEKELLSTVPDERMYSSVLGKIEWKSEKEVVLTSKDGRTYVCVCN